MNNIRVSVGILTFNSARTLERALRSVEQCDDIIICDGGSTDATLEIAHQYGCRVIAQDKAFQRPDGRLADYAGVRNQCLAAARYPYFFYIDSDEAASPALIEALRHIADAGDSDGYRIPIRMWIGDTLVEHSSNYPGYQYRIVRTDRGVAFRKAVHERPAFRAEPDRASSTLDAPWYVYLERDYVEHYMTRNWKFIEIERERNRSMRFGTFLFRFLPRNLKSVAGIALRTLRDRLLYPWHTCMPLSVEIGRIRYHLALIRVIGASFVRV